jgi:hypothetical protein
MWLDLKDVKDNGAGMNTLKIDDQNPGVVAWKLSPTEVGLKVHERFDVERVLNLVAAGKSVTPAWATYDGVKYFVFSNDGPNAESLVGAESTYDYETKWPYAWMEGNSKDNKLPVNLHINKVDKPNSWIKLSSTAALKSEVKGTLTPPTVTRSDGYDGKLTWKSSNEDVVKVDAETGALTIVGPGTATITVSGAETDYRYAPASVSYQVVIYMIGDANADGTVNAADIVEVVNCIMGSPSAKFSIDGADANADGTVNAADIVAIVNIIMGN